MRSIQLERPMEKDNTTAASATAPSIAELEFRRYEARLGVWKVVLGTFIVGLAGGILIPGAIQFYNTQLDDARRGTELRLSQQTAHQEYIKDFFSTAVNQDIELRIRFADYFANLSGEGQDQLWKNYLRDLTDLRDNVEFDRINRELAWANKEIGYVPTERSAVIAWADSSPIGKKLRLYSETTDLVQRLTSGSRPLTEFPDDLERFWNLYRKDLIGVESSEFARVMIEIGHTLDVLVASSSPPNAELRRLADNLVSISRRELADISQVAVQQQQQQQQMPQQQQQQVPYPQ